MNLSIAIIGIGRLGGALAIALSKNGYAVEQLISRQSEKARKIAESIVPTPEILTVDAFEKINAPIVFITTPDQQIEIVADELAEKINYRPFVFHASGALSSDVLSSLRAVGCRTASIHPLVSISDSETGARRFKNAYFCVEGDRQAVRVAEKIVVRLEGNAFSVETKFKTLYHAAAVMASGHAVALLSAAIEALAACGLTEDEAQKILLPLVAGTAANLSAQNPARALTGTFARADVETLKRHLETLGENVSADVLSIYLQLGKRSIRLAELQGADRENLSAMKKLLAETENERQKSRQRQ